MNKRKRTLIAIVSCILVVAVSFGISYAFLIDKVYVPNSFTVGETTIQVAEEFTPPDKLEPGIEFTKKPWVVNEGNLPCFVRVQITFSDNKAEEFSSLDINLTDWEKQSDGYYYYKKLLKPGEKTTSLFTKVTIKDKKTDGSNYQESDMIDFNLLVYGEAVNHTSHIGTNHPDDEYKTVWSEYQKTI